MRFITITLTVHAPDPRTGEQKSTQERFREVLASASLAEELGFDGFGVDGLTGARREIPDPPWGWGGGPIGDDAVPARAVAVSG